VISTAICQRLTVNAEKYTWRQELFRKGKKDAKKITDTGTTITGIPASYTDGR